MWLLKMASLSIIIGFTLSACHDSPSFNDPVVVYGPYTKLTPGLNFDNKLQFSAKKNGIPFVGNFDVISHNSICEGCFSIILMTFEDSIVKRDRIAITNLNIRKKDYELLKNLNHQATDDIGDDKPSKSYYSTHIDDQRLDSYQLYEMADNWIRFESVDTVTGIIRGSFQVHYEKTWEQDPTAPKYVKFSDGAFEFNYKE